MREITKEEIKKAVAELFFNANTNLGSDVKNALQAAKAQEKNPNAQKMLAIIIENYQLAEENQTPICQDTGMAVVFVDWGSEVILRNASLEEAVNEGVKEAYQEGYFRKSIVKDPLRRENTLDNTPAIIHTRIIPGEKVKITAIPKGFGSENMGSLKMFNPTATWGEIETYIVDVVKKAGANACPPLIVGVGIGGTMEKAALLAKEALLRKVLSKHPDPFWAEKEENLLLAVNKTGIGTQGISGTITALACHIEVFPTHIAGLPVAVNLNCHVSRHQEVWL